MQKIYWFLCCILLCSASPLLAQKVSFTGIVTDKISGEPLDESNVYFNGTHLSTVTNKKGVFQLNDIKPGTYELIVSCVGYKSVKQEITLSEAKTKLDFGLTKSNSTLGEIVVTGTGTPHHLKGSPVQTELINNKLVESIGSSNFNDLMMGVSPSFDFAPGSMGPFMQLNGLGNDYILVLINGKRIYGDIGGQNDLNRINPDNIERIEVVKGASSTLYGSDAIAGVINVITKESKDKINVANSSRIGNYGEWVQHNSLNLNLGKLFSSTSFDRKTTDGWQLSPYKLVSNELVATDAMAQYPTKDYTLSQKFEYSLTQQLKLYAQGTKYVRDITRPTSVTAYNFNYNDFSYAAGAEYLLGKVNKITVDWSSDHFKYNYIYNQNSGNYTEGEKVEQTDQLLNNLNLKGIFKLSKSQTLSVGGEYLNETLKSAARLSGDKADAYTLSLYGQDEIELLKNLSLVAGLRYVNHKEFGSAFTPKASLMYKLKNINFRGTYARGFKTPTLKDLYYHYQQGSTLYVGSTDLKPENSNYYAISSEYIVNGLSFSVTGYQNDIDNLIGFKTITTDSEDAANGVTTTKQYTNIEKAGTKGVDFLFNANLGYGFSLGGGYSYVDARNKTEDIRLENVAHNYANIRLGYVHGWKKYKLSVNLNGRLQDGKFYDDSYGNSKGYNLWNLVTNHNFKTTSAFDLGLAAGIENIFDYVDNSPYGSHYGTISPGRTYFATLKIEFKK